MRILTAEDDFTSRSMLAGVLKKSGHDVVEAENGQEAWDRLQHADAPRLAILDWIMPGMDGPDIVRRVRALQTNRPPYLIILTTRDKKADIVAGLDAGANDYLAKPFDSGELQARVEVGRRMIEMQDTLPKPISVTVSSPIVWKHHILNLCKTKLSVRKKNREPNFRKFTQSYQSINNDN